MSQVLFNAVGNTSSKALELEVFLSKVKSDASLQQQLRGATGAADIAAIARAAGISITTADIDGLTHSKANILTDGELDDMAGVQAVGCYQTCARNSTKLT